MIDFKLPTNSQLREQAIEMSNLEDFTPGLRNEVWDRVVKNFFKLQMQYYPMFCEDTRVQNAKRKKFLDDYGNKSSTKMMGGKVYEGTTGWSKDGLFKDKWIISDQLMYFMMKIDNEFWADNNARVRDSFMKGIMRGDDYYELLDKVYKHYGANVTESFTEKISI